MGRENKRSGDDANLQLPNFYVLPVLFSHLSVFQSCVSWTPFCIFCCYVSQAVVSGTYISAAVS